MALRRRTLRRPLHVAIGDKRSPMLRLLLDAERRSGVSEVSYDQQWRTQWKAQRLGYLDDRALLTDAGRAFIAKHRPAPGA